ncbi:hypothetical protein PHYPSEUDO_002182 [Phytophthora pseudosyringae]|uniref:Uncharacterized protein n=1 Tax=Phytophthora pseudosyringae TaxID=221518 RepID=A0A8T1VUG7_9STRA|nr:hypothetical protein PHYPSEUDO_002182 [Phytophthora pseudosyringae]
MQDPLQEKLAALAKWKVFLVAATLHPEALYRGTNCFVLPEGDYSAFLFKLTSCANSVDNERGFLFGGSDEDEDGHLTKTPRKRVVPLATAKMIKRPSEQLRLLHRQLLSEEEGEADDRDTELPVVIDVVSSESDQDHNPHELNWGGGETWDVILFSIVGSPSAPVPQPKGSYRWQS